MPFSTKKKRCDASEKTKREKEPTCYIVKANTECKCKIQKKSLWINQKAYLIKDKYLLSTAAGYLLLHFTQGCRKKVNRRFSNESLKLQPTKTWYHITTPPSHRSTLVQNVITKMLSFFLTIFCPDLVCLYE